VLGALAAPAAVIHERSIGMNRVKSQGPKPRRQLLGGFG
jgi:hypothetical protein